MSQGAFTDLLGVSRCTVGNWERGGAILPASERRLRELAGTLARGEADASLSLADEVAQVRQRVDYLEAVVIQQRADELAARRNTKALSESRPTLRSVADSHVDVDKEIEGYQEEP